MPSYQSFLSKINAARQKSRALQKLFPEALHIFEIFSIHDYLNLLILAMF